MCTLRGGDKTWNRFRPELTIAISESSLSLKFSASIKDNHLPTVVCVFRPRLVCLVASIVLVWIPKPTVMPPASHYQHVDVAETIVQCTELDTFK